MEFWYRWIGDFLNALNVLCRRFEECQSDDELVSYFNNLLAEILSIRARFKAVISTNANQCCHELSNFRFPNDIAADGTAWGRPKELQREEL